MNFTDIKFGYTDAEDEITYVPELLMDGFFDDYGYIDAIVKTKKFLVLGQKGSGKSAIGYKLKVMSDNNKDFFTKIYDLKKFPFGRFSEIIPSKEAPQTKYPDNWEFILMIAALNSLINDDTFRYTNTKKTKSILKALFEHGLISKNQEVTLDSLVRVTTDKKFKVDLKYLSFESSTEKETNIDVKTLYYDLQEVFYSIEVECPHFIVIDGLDDVLTQRQKQYQSIAALISAANTINKKLHRSVIPIKIVVLCRTDLFNKLVEPNKNKIKTDSAIILDWYQYNTDLASTNLAKLINLRAKISVGKDIDVFSQCLPIDYHHLGQKKDMIHVLFEYTRHIPRDIVQLFNEIQEHTKIAGGNKPSKANIKYGLESYSKNYFVGEIMDHLCGFVDDEEIQKSFNLLAQIGTHRFDILDLKAHAERDDNYKSINIDNLVNVLFECNAIGNIDKKTNRVTFKYRQPYAAFTSNEDILLHFALSLGLKGK